MIIIAFIVITELFIFKIIITSRLLLQAWSFQFNHNGISENHMKPCIQEVQFESFFEQSPSL